VDVVAARALALRPGAQRAWDASPAAAGEHEVVLGRNALGRSYVAQLGRAARMTWLKRSSTCRAGLRSRFADG
jgi:hypothetical protein